MTGLPDPGEWAAKEGRGTSPPGFVFVWREDTVLFPVEEARPCRYLIDRRACREPSVVKIDRSRGEGTVRRWWHYCAAHAFGRIVVDGIVYRIVLADLSKEVGP